MTSLERNINDLTELKIQHKNVMRQAQVSIAESTKWKKEYQSLKTVLLKLDRQTRLEKKEWKGTNKTSEKCGTMLKRLNLRLIGVPEKDRENGTKLENTFQDIIQENFLNLARQANIQI